MIYDNEKLNEIYRDTWPNLGWAKKDHEELKNDRKSQETDGRHMGREE